MDLLISTGGGSFEWTNLLIIVGVIATVMIVLKLLKSSIKRIIKIAINAAVGCIILYGFSLIPNIGFSVEWWHALLTGLFGIPAAVLIMVLHFFI